MIEFLRGALSADSFMMVVRAIVGNDMASSWEFAVDGVFFIVPSFVYFWVMFKWIWEETD